MKLTVALLFAIPSIKAASLRGDRMLSGDSPCDFDVEALRFYEPEICGTGVIIAVDPFHAPQTGSSFPFGFVDLAVKMADQPDSDFICLDAKGYSTKEVEDDGNKILTFKGHVLFTTDEDLLTAPPVENIEPNKIYWMQGGILEEVTSDCTYDPDTTAWDCSGPTTVTKAKGVFKDLCK